MTANQVPLLLNPHRRQLWGHLARPNPQLDQLATGESGTGELPGSQRLYLAFLVRRPRPWCPPGTLYPCRCGASRTSTMTRRRFGILPRRLTELREARIRNSVDNGQGAGGPAGETALGHRRVPDRDHGYTWQVQAEPEPLRCGPCWCHRRAAHYLVTTDHGRLPIAWKPRRKENIHEPDRACPHRRRRAALARVVCRLQRLLPGRGAGARSLM